MRRAGLRREGSRRAGLRRAGCGWGWSTTTTSATQAGIAALSPGIDTVVFMDADASDRPEEMDRLLAPIAAGAADMVIGSRPAAAEPGSLTPQQRFGNALACWLIRKVWRVRFTDLGPFRAITRAGLARLEMQDRNYGWTVEMQVRAAGRGLRCAEVPVGYRPRIGRSKVSGTISGSVKAGVKILWVIGVEALRRPR